MKEEHLGSNLDGFLREENLLEDSDAAAAKRVIAFQIAKEMRRRRAGRSRDLGAGLLAAIQRQTGVKLK